MKVQSSKLTFWGSLKNARIWLVLASAALAVIALSSSADASFPSSEATSSKHALSPASPADLCSWTTVANYPISVAGNAVTTDGTFAYSIGGWDSSAAVNLVQRYDPAT